MHTVMYTYACIHTRVATLMHPYACLHLCTHPCIQTRAPIHVHPYACIYIHVHIHVHMHVPILRHTQTHLNDCIHTHTPTHVHPYTCRFTRMPTDLPKRSHGDSHRRRVLRNLSGTITLYLALPAMRARKKSKRHSEANWRFRASA